MALRHRHRDAPPSKTKAGGSIRSRLSALSDNEEEAERKLVEEMQWRFGAPKWELSRPKKASHLRTVVGPRPLRAPEATMFMPTSSAGAAAAARARAAAAASVRRSVGVIA